MTELLIFSFLAGAVLGQRFRVLVLLPLTFAMMVIAIPAGLVADLSFVQGLKNLVLTAIALQAGYLFGSAARFALGAARAARILPRQVKTAR
ncbi:hypothetical protein JIR23_08610 [Bradyrhizobium diazoefficiens]|nr:hypothetical protein [Bradyrhizobium diazoefficiens]QQN65733.1 hypothetical protein JIR23_08610 [Bradyrhizobium diazoefficiens]